MEKGGMKYLRNLYIICVICMVLFAVLYNTGFQMISYIPLSFVLIFFGVGVFYAIKNTFNEKTNN